MSDHQAHHHGSADNGNAILPHHPTRRDDEGLQETSSFSQSPTLDDFHGSFNPFGLLSRPYDYLGNSGTLVNYQNAFQSIDYHPQHHLQEFSGAQPNSMQAPSDFLNPPVLEQAWIEEIHSSYTSISGGPLDWSSYSRSPGGFLNTTFTGQSEQLEYENIPAMLPANQYAPSDTTVSGTLIAQFVPETMPKIPLKQALSTLPASVAVKVRNEKLKKDITTILYDKAEHIGYKPLRVSKTKKGEKFGNNPKQEACWRCKRYRKACIGQDICKECSTAGFRVWPSAIGCRRGAMEGFVEKIMPSHSVGVLRDLRVGVSRTSNWRKALYPPAEVLSTNGTNSAGRWEMLKLKVQSTMVFGADFSALVDILATYEKSINTEIPIWTQSILLLSSTCDFYHFFVASSNTEIQLPNLINATIKFRKSLLRSWDMFLKLSLSGRRENWFTAFLTVVLGICSMVIIFDAVPSVPDPTRKAIWSDIEEIIKDVRVRQHMMSLDLLRIGAKGINPLKLDCWVAEEDIDSDGKTVLRRNSKGMALLGHDSAAFDGFIALHLWHSKHKAAMSQGNDMWDSVPYTLAHIRAIAALSRVFEF